MEVTQKVRISDLKMRSKIGCISKKLKYYLVFYSICTIFAAEHSYVVMNTNKVIESIKQVAKRILPKGSMLYLYGSRARGDWHEGSDWDLLVLLDKPRLEHEDFNKYSYPFVEMGWDIGEDIRPHAYTKQEWFNGPHAMFYFNVEEDKKVLYDFK